MEVGFHPPHASGALAQRAPAERRQTDGQSDLSVAPKNMVKYHHHTPWKQAMDWWVCLFVRRPEPCERLSKFSPFSQGPFLMGFSSLWGMIDIGVCMLSISHVISKANACLPYFSTARIWNPYPPEPFIMIASSKQGKFSPVKIFHCGRMGPQQRISHHINNRRFITRVLMRRYVHMAAVGGSFGMVQIL